MSELLLYAPLVIGASYLLGWGATNLLIPERFRGYEAVFAPWVGMAQTTLLMAFFGYFGVGVKRSWPSAVAIASLLLVLALVRRKPRFHVSALRILFPIILVVIMLLLFLVPAVLRTKALNTFTLANNDPFSYVVSAKWVGDHGLFPLPRPGLHSTADYNIYLQLGHNPRWLPILYLSFLSSAFSVDPVRLFSLLQTVALAWQLSLVWLLGRQIFGLTGVGLGVGFLLAALNPYPTYIALQGFMPQVLGTGFFLGFLVLLPFYLEDERWRWREAACLALFGTGILTSYLELVPFALALFGGYALWTAARRGAWVRRLGGFLVVTIAVAALNPFHTTRVIDFLWSHIYSITQDSNYRSGWPMPSSYTDMAGLLQAKSFGLWLALLVTLGALSAFGIAARQPRRAFVVLMAIPFLAAIGVAYRADYSYAFFKGLSYVYFWLPLVIGQGVAPAAAWCRSVSSVRAVRWSLVSILTVSLVALIWNEAGNTQKLQKQFALRRIVNAPLELAALEPFNADPRIDDIFISGLNFWESLWAIYYLPDKRIGMTWSNGYVQNEIGLMNDGKWRFLLAPDGFHTLIGDGKRRMEAVMVRAGRFSFGRLEPTQETGLGDLTLGRGFYSVEHDGREEWVWAGREGEILVNWPGPPASVLLTIEFGSVHAQTLRVFLNDRQINTIAVEVDLRRVYEIPLPLVAGRNRVMLSSDLDVLPARGRDPRSLNLRVFSINLERQPSQVASGRGR